MKGSEVGQRVLPVHRRANPARAATFGGGHSQPVGSPILASNQGRSVVGVNEGKECKGNEIAEG